MKRYEVSYVVNHELCSMDVEASSKAAALSEVYDRLKKIGAPFLLYGALERS
ncbi:MAG: hypothetical protein ACI4D0_10845 [Lachnospira sp.]